MKTTVAVRLPDETVKQLDAIVAHRSKAAGVQLSRSDIARIALEDGIKREAKKAGVLA